jgi:hypothetical protein
VQQFGYVDNGELAHPTQQIARRKWISYELFMVNGKWKLPGQPLVKKLSADTQTKYFSGGHFLGCFLVDLVTYGRHQNGRRDWGLVCCITGTEGSYGTLFAFYAKQLHHKTPELFNW